MRSEISLRSIPAACAAMAAIFFVWVTPVIGAVVANEAEGADTIDPHDVSGLWRTPDDVLVEIDQCAESVCGTVIWFPALEAADGVVLDVNNDDETLRDREIRGMQIIYGFQKKRKGWRKGRIYDPESGETYKSKLTRLTTTDLKVQGCVGPVCKSFIWTRADGDVPAQEKPTPAPASNEG